MSRTAVALVAMAAFMGPVMAPSDATAQEVEKTPEITGKRIAIAGRQSMLAEGLAKSLCYIQSGIESESSSGDLYVNWNIYSWYHRGIYDGNYQLGLFGERDNRVKRKWLELDKTWEPIAEMYNMVIDGRRLSERDFDQVMTMTKDLVVSNNEFVAQLRSTYADDISSSGNLSALLIDLYERSRMLAQKLSKEVCLIERGYDVETSRAELQDTIKFFAASLDAFIDGLPALGIPPAPTVELRDQLLAARTDWDAVSGMAKGVAAGESLDDAQLGQFHSGMDLFLSKMNKAVQLLVMHETHRA